MDNDFSNFRSRVEAVVMSIPYGRVMTYGQIAALCGSPRAARVVGSIAHFGSTSIPWQRVVNRQGGLASGYPGGRLGHRIALEREGVKFRTNYTVDLNSLIWWPDFGNAQ
jgi:methylated-DNA-protein-cysteine methyltransferase-like protein